MGIRILNFLTVTTLMILGGCSKEPGKHWRSSDTFIIDPTMSIGPVFNGMTMQQAREQLGEPTRDTDSVLVYSELGLQILPGKGGFTEAIVCSAAKEPFFKQAFSGHTPEGIGIDSTLEQVIAAYGKPTSQRTSKTGNEDLFYESIGMRFVISNGRVLQMVVLFGRERH